MWRGQRVSVVFPTYNEKDSIYDAVRSVLDTGYVDEVLVVDRARVKTRRISDSSAQTG